MKKVYLKYPYLKSLESTIVAKYPIGSLFHIELEKTIFCPRIDDLCPCDYGTINDKKIIDVYLKENKILHVIESDMEHDHCTLKIDWNRRRRIAEYLTTKFLMESYLHQFFHIKDIKFSIKENSAIFICDKIPGVEKILEYMEDDLNHMIDSALPIQIEERFERMKGYTIKRYFGSLPSYGSFHLKHMLLSNSNELFGFHIREKQSDYKHISITFTVGQDLKKEYNDLTDLKTNYITHLLHEWYKNNKIFIDLKGTGLYFEDFPPISREHLFIEEESFRGVLSSENEFVLQDFPFERSDHMIIGNFNEKNRKQLIQQLLQIKK